MKTNFIQKFLILVGCLFGFYFSNAQQTIWQGCATATYSVTNTPGSTYAWSVTPPVGTITVGTPTNSIGIDWTSVAEGNYTVSVTETNSNGCPGTPQNVLVAIIATPVPDVAVTPPTCSVATATIEVTAPVGTGYQYSIDNGTTWQSSTTFNNVVANTTYDVVVKSQTGCLSTVTQVVVIPQPVGPTTSPITYN